jgi:hypothetical protein
MLNILFSIAFFVLTLNGNAQDSTYVSGKTSRKMKLYTKMYPDSLEKILVKLTNHEQLKGSFLTVTNDTLLMRIALINNIKISVNDIAYIGPLAYDERRKHTNFITPTGMGLDKGDIQYTNTLLFYNRMDFGITRWLGGGIGCILIPGESLFGGASFRLHHSITESVHFSGGYMISFSNDDGIMHFPYASLSLGNTKSHIDFYYNRMFMDSGNESDHLLGISGSIQVGRNNFLLLNACFSITIDYHTYSAYSIKPGGVDKNTEAWMYPMLGFRKNYASFSFDVGMMFDPAETTDMYFFPFASITVYRFPKKYKYQYFEEKMTRRKNFEKSEDSDW